MNDKKNNLNGNGNELQHSDLGNDSHVETRSFEINSKIQTRNGNVDNFNPNIEKEVAKSNNPFDK